MAKGFCVAMYRSVSDPNKLAAYAKLAGSAIQAVPGGHTPRSVGGAWGQRSVPLVA